MRSMDDLLPVLMGLHDADPDLVPALIQAWLFPVDAYDIAHPQGTLRTWQ